jgi:hypothetical protein
MYFSPPASRKQGSDNASLQPLQSASHSNTTAYTRPTAAWQGHTPGRLMTWLIQSHSIPLTSTAKQAEEKKASSNTNRYTLV